MCNQRPGNVKTSNGGKKNVTQKQNKGKRTARGNKTRNAKDAEGYSGNVANAAADACPKPRDSRAYRSGSSASGQSRANRSGAVAKEGNTSVRMQLPSSSKSSGASGSNRKNGVSRYDSQNGSNDVRSRVWKASEVSPRLRKNGGIQGKFKVDQEVVLVTTWTALFEDLCPDGTQAFRDSIVDYGLVGTIIRFQRIASALINSSTPHVLDTNLVSALKKLSLRDALQLMRFGKRYTPLEWDSVMEESVYTAFHRRNNRAKLMNRKGIPYWLERRLNKVGTQLCKAAVGRRKLENFIGTRTYVGDLHHLPTGTTAEGLRNPFEKWLYVSALWRTLDPFTLDAIDTLDIGCRDVYSKVVMVPKDYRGPRIIMEELLEVTLQQSMIADAVMKVIACDNRQAGPYSAAHAIKLDDQTQNQDMAYLGSLHGYHSTLDLKDASDSISAALIWAVFPPEWAELILSHATAYTLLPNNKVYDLHMPCTMGSRMTVPVQSLIYWVIVCVAVDILVGLGILDDYSILSDCSVYNDDIVVPDVLYDTVRDLLELCGLIVNEDKSYTGEHPFRESCGVDVYDGNIVTSIYWPRKALDVANDELPSLCALQNRLYSIGAHKAAAVIESYVLMLCPKIPCIKPGDDRIGLYTPIPQIQASPYICDDVRADSNDNWYVEIVDYPYGNIDSAKLVVRRARRNATRSTVHLTLFNELRPYCQQLLNHCPWARTVEITHDFLGDDTEVIDLASITGNTRLSHMPIRREKRKIILNDVYRVHEPVLLQTYDNRMIGKLNVAGLTHDQISSVFERFEYERWLLQGSEYYDDWCRVLHVTQPSRLRNRLYASGYKVGTCSYTTVNK